MGKGITFDTGGINLKASPASSIETMYADMCGAGAVLGAFHALAVLNPSVNVIGAACLADNAIDANSYYPSAIIKSYKGDCLYGVDFANYGRFDRGNHQHRC